VESELDMIASKIILFSQTSLGLVG